MISLKLLNKKEREEINQVMHYLESQEIYPLLAIAKESDPYPGALIRITLFVSIILSLIFTYLFKIQFSFLYALLPLFFILLTLPLIRFFNLKKLALSKGEITREVSEKAYEEFFKNSLAGEESENQLFIYLSMLENRFEIVFGRKLNQKIKDSTKEEMAQKLQAGFKDKNYAQAIKDVLVCLKLDETNNTEKNENTPDKSIKNRIFFI